MRVQITKIWVQIGSCFDLGVCDSDNRGQVGALKNPYWT